MAPEPGAIEPEPPEAPGADGHDPARRRFFRSFGRQAFDTAAQVVGITGAVSKATTQVAVNVAGIIADPDGTAERLSAEPDEPEAAAAPAGASGPPVSHRSPYRLAGDTLHLLDQRSLPGRLEEQVCRRGSDVAFYARVGAVAGGALLGQLAAYGLALTAREVVPRSHPARLAEWGRVLRTLRGMRSESRMLEVALARMDALHASYGPDADPDRIARDLRAEADRIAMESQLDHATIARTIAARLPCPDERPLGVLVHGAPGTSTAGMVGGALNALALVAQEGRPMQVWLTEGGPALPGPRLAAWELGNHGIEPVIVPDAAVGSLLDTQPVDIVLLGAERISVDGEVANVVGSRVVAELAAAARRGPVPVWVAAPAEAIDPATAETPIVVGELRPAREILTYRTGWKPDRPAAYIPVLDIVPADRVALVVTEIGVTEPGPGTLAPVLAARLARRPAPPAPWQPAPGEPEPAGEPERETTAEPGAPA